VSWDAVGALAELVGAVGVIASLFYLAAQIRRNSASVEAATARAISEATQERLLAPAQTVELAEAIRKGFSGEVLSDTERVQLMYFTRATFRGIESMVIQHSRGLVSDDLLSGFRTVLESNLHLSVVQQWWSGERSTFDPAFRTLVDELLEASPAGEGGGGVDGRRPAPAASS
jgi:hypothetical protein